MYLFSVRDKLYSEVGRGAAARSIAGRGGVGWGEGPSLSTALNQFFFPREDVRPRETESGQGYRPLDDARELSEEWHNIESTSIQRPHRKVVEFSDKLSKCDRFRSSATFRPSIAH